MPVHWDPFCAVLGPAQGTQTRSHATNTGVCALSRHSTHTHTKHPTPTHTSAHFSLKVPMLTSELVSLWREASWPSNRRLCVPQSSCWQKASSHHLPPTHTLNIFWTQPAGTFMHHGFFTWYSEYQQFILCVFSGFLTTSTLCVFVRPNKHVNVFTSHKSLDSKCVPF